MQSERGENPSSEENNNVVELPQTELMRLRAEKEELKNQDPTPENQKNLRTIRNRINEIALTISGAEESDTPPDKYPPNNAA